MPSRKTASESRERAHSASPTWKESWTFLLHLDGQLAGPWLFDLLDHEPKPFEPLVFLEKDEGGFISLFEVVVTSLEKEKRQSILSRRLEESIREDLSELDPARWRKLWRGELDRRALRAALGLEEIRDRPATAAKARDWILKNNNPVPLVQDPLPWDLCFFHFSVGPGGKPGPGVEMIRRHLRNYLEHKPAGLTVPDESGDTEEVTSRQEREPESDPGRKLLEEGILPQTRRRGQGMFLTSYRGLNLLRLQQKMWKAARKSGLTLSEIAQRMGLDTTGRNPRSQVYHLLKDAKDPGFFTVLRFCNAVGLSLDELLSPRKTRK